MIVFVNGILGIYCCIKDTKATIKASPRLFRHLPIPYYPLQLVVCLSWCYSIFEEVISQLQNRSIARCAATRLEYYSDRHHHYPGTPPSPLAEMRMMILFNDFLQQQIQLCF